MPVDPLSYESASRSKASLEEVHRPYARGIHPAFKKAMQLAVVTGLRGMLGPALVSEAGLRPQRRNLALAAMGEMLLEKLPIMPSSNSLPMLLPRVLAGAWVAKTVMESEGIDDPWSPAMGAAVAAGVASISPLVRASLSRILGVPEAAIGLAEDYLALRLGTDAVGLSLDDVARIAGHSVEEVKNLILPALQSPGTGSM
jgi:hypothetical protein